MAKNTLFRLKGTHFRHVTLYFPLVKLCDSWKRRMLCRRVWRIQLSSIINFFNNLIITLKSSESWSGNRLKPPHSPPRCLRPAAGVCSLVPSGLRTRVLAKRCRLSVCRWGLCRGAYREAAFEDQDVHLLFSCQDAPRLLNFFVIAPQSVYARDTELVAGAQFFHQSLIPRSFEILPYCFSYRCWFPGCRTLPWR